MRKTATIVIGAGHAGLAMSRCLAERAIDHVVLEKGEVGRAWRTGRWDSLRLLTPNWQRRLPGFGYDGPDPDGFESAGAFARFLERYAALIGAPVETGTTVLSVSRDETGYLVATDRGLYRAPTVVVATGACAQPVVPRVAVGLPSGIASLTPAHYRNPGRLPPGGVLVVGASATGVQLAHEIRLAGREVTLAVGEHIRAPRTYRGRDIQWWMDRAGILDERHDEVDDITRARRVPSLQLVGDRHRTILDLNALAAIGVRLAGRVVGVADGRIQFSGALANLCQLSDLKMNRLLDTIDAWAATAGLDADAAPPHRFPPTRVPERPPLALDLAAERIGTVIWATGFRPDHSFLSVPILDGKGRIRHEGGVTPSPGLAVMGLPFLRRRKSALIDGAADDARDLSAHLAAYLARGGAVWRPGAAAA